jgi:hypothetical protein
MQHLCTEMVRPRVEGLGLCLPFEKEMCYHSIVTSPMTLCPTLRGKSSYSCIGLGII